MQHEFKKNILRIPSWGLKSPVYDCGTPTVGANIEAESGAIGLSVLLFSTDLASYCMDIAHTQQKWTSCFQNVTYVI